MSEQTAPSLKPSSRAKAVSTVAFAAAIVVIVVVVVVGAVSYVWAQGYDGRIAPNVWIGPIAVGGMDPEVASQKVHEAVDAYVLEGVNVTLDGSTKRIPVGSIPTSDTGSSSDYVTFDVDAAIAQALQAKRASGSVVDAFTLASALVDGTHIDIPTTVDRTRLENAIDAAFPYLNLEQQPLNAGFAFTLTASGWTASVTPSHAGEVIAFDAFFAELPSHLSTLDESSLVLASSHGDADVSEADVQPLLPIAEAVVARAPFTLSYEPDRFSPQSWTISAQTLTQALAVEKQDGIARLVITTDGLAETFDLIATAIERPASDARFTIENGRVSEFAASETGISLDRDATAAALTALLVDNTQTTTDVVVTVVEPTLATGQVNDLGITEELGVGTSNYRNSPPNRIKNIRNGVRLLNGLLIQPGETFSLVAALKPFETDNGYLPELVIKGDKIQPEIAGGLCQIGTTTFRAAMNSGLPIVERSNHSLVVSYYNDPSNGNPGTDATIYDPNPDLKFTNDTGHAILFQAIMDEPNTTLRFSFWGTSDGRKGYYSPPEVIRWIGAGEPKTVETPDLDPGVQKCQAVHTGADAQFTYTIEHADGTKDDTVFTSHYRALPQICLVGIDPNAPPPPEPSPDDATGDTGDEAIPVTDVTAPTDATVPTDATATAQTDATSTTTTTP